MAEFEEVINLKTKTTGTDSVKSLKQELKEAKNEAIQAARSFGEFDPRALSAAKKVAQLNEEMTDFNERVQGLNPNRFEAINGVVQGVAGGIAAATGAMALFGGESEETAKTLAKVQGAIAFSQGIEQILSMDNAFGSLANTIKTKLVTAFSTLKGALIATGIGALIVGIGLLISKLNDLSDAAAEAARDFEKAMSAIEKNRVKDNLSAELALARAKARGADEKELFEIRQQYAKLYFNDLVELQKKAGVNQAEVQEKIDAALKQRELDLVTFQSEQAQKRLAEQKQANEKLAAEQKRHNEELLQQEQQNAERVKQLKDQQSIDAFQAQQQINEDLEKSQLDQYGQQAFELQKWYDEQKRIIQDGGGDITALNELFNQRTAEIQVRALEDESERQKKADAEALAAKDKRSKEEAAINKRNADARKAVEQEAFNNASALLGQTAQLFGQTTAAGKAFALAQIGADTARALSGALANSQSPTPDNVATGGLAGIAKYIGLAAMILQNINRARQILGAGGGGQAAAPQTASFNPITSGSLPGSDEVAGQRWDSKVYIIEGEMTNAQKRVRNNRSVSVI